MNKTSTKKQSPLKFRGFLCLKDNFKINRPLVKLAAFLALLVFIRLFVKSGIGCVWQHFFGIPCPGCGTTRAAIALLRGDFAAMLRYNFMLPSLPILFLYVIFDGQIFKNKSVDYLILSIIAVGFIIHWITLLV